MTVRGSEGVEVGGQGGGAGEGRCPAVRLSGWSEPRGGQQGGWRRGNEECRGVTVCVCV